MLSHKAFWLVVFGYFMFSLSIYGKVIFDWSDTKTSVIQRQKVEDVLRLVVSKYLDENYGALGPLDFYEAKEKCFLKIDSGQTGRHHSNWSMGSGSSVVFLSADIMDDLPELGACLTHEFSHAYDLIMTHRLQDLYKFAHFPLKYRPKIPVARRLEWVSSYMYNRSTERNLGEHRALNKEEEYTESKKEVWGIDKYTELRSALQSAREALVKTEKKEKKEDAK